MKKVVLLAILSSFIYAQNCSIDYSVLYAIAKNEGHSKRKVGYPYIISFNNKKDLDFLISSLVEKDKNKIKKLDNRSIDCKTQKRCIAIYKYLKKNDITNIDLGAFQINAKFHSDSPDVYFNLKKSYQKACSIVETLKMRHGWSWKTIGRYHSSTSSLNRKYIKRLKQNLIKG